MPLGTLDRRPPPFFHQGPSALTRLAVFSAVALFLMAADTRFAVARSLQLLASKREKLRTRKHGNTPL